MVNLGVVGVGDVPAAVEDAADEAGPGEVAHVTKVGVVIGAAREEEAWGSLIP